MFVQLICVFKFKNKLYKTRWIVTKATKRTNSSIEYIRIPQIKIANGAALAAVDTRCTNSTITKANYYLGFVAFARHLDCSKLQSDGLVKIRTY